MIGGHEVSPRTVVEATCQTLAYEAEARLDFRDPHALAISAGQAVKAEKFPRQVASRHRGTGASNRPRSGHRKGMAFASNSIRGTQRTPYSYDPVGFGVRALIAG